MSETIFSAFHAERHEQVPKGIPLIVALSGMSDPAGVVAQLDGFFWQHCAPQELLRFDRDVLLDYRARRPTITFNEDHFEDYAPEELTLQLCHDQLGSPFLLLSGFEPDFRWESCVSALLALVEQFQVSVTVSAHGVPMPVPHTRPLRATVSGTRSELIETRSVWKPQAKLPVSLSQLVEYRLQQLGFEVVGFAVLVPHYLASNEYPEALVFALDSVMSATGLIFATDEVRASAKAFQEQVDQQVAENEESRTMLHGLEARYDTYMENQSIPSPLVSVDGEIPTADQLASEFEQFLAQHREDPHPNDGTGASD